MVYFVLGLVALVVVLFFAIGYFISAPVYRGNPTDHFDGKKFKNLGGAEAKNLGDVFRWLASRKPGSWPPAGQVTLGAKPAHRLSDDTLRITYVNHTTFLIQVGGLNILTDPIWSERCSPFSFAGPRRVRPAGIAFDDLPTIHLVLISHNHYDHLDLPTLKRLYARDRPQIITPLGVGAFIEQQGLGKANDMDWWQTLSLTQTLQLVCVPAQHFSGRGLFDRNQTLWCGFVLQTQVGNLFFAGDTGYGEIFKTIAQKYSPMRVSLLPIGAFKPEWFMSPIHISPKQAVQIHQEVSSQLSIASHYGTFPLADDGFTDPANELQAALAQQKIDPAQFVLLPEGQFIDIVK